MGTAYLGTKDSREQQLQWAAWIMASDAQYPPE
jgi:hypothetical protein